MTVEQLRALLATMPPGAVVRLPKAEFSTGGEFLCLVWAELGQVKYSEELDSIELSEG